jgi:hypothetical protein
MQLVIYKSLILNHFQYQQEEAGFRYQSFIICFVFLHHLVICKQMRFWWLHVHDYSIPLLQNLKVFMKLTFHTLFADLLKLLWIKFLFISCLCSFNFVVAVDLRKFHILISITYYEISRNNSSIDFVFRWIKDEDLYFVSYMFFIPSIHDYNC